MNGRSLFFAEAAEGLFKEAAGASAYPSLERAAVEFLQREHKVSQEGIERLNRMSPAERAEELKQLTNPPNPPNPALPQPGQRRSPDLAGIDAFERALAAQRASALEGPSESPTGLRATPSGQQGPMGPPDAPAWPQHHPQAWPTEWPQVPPAGPPAPPTWPKASPPAPPAPPAPPPQASPAELAAYKDFISEEGGGGFREKAKADFQQYEVNREKSERGSGGFWDGAYRGVGRLGEMLGLTSADPGTSGGTFENIDPDEGFSSSAAKVYGSASEGPEQAARTLRNASAGAVGSLAAAPMLASGGALGTAVGLGRATTSLKYLAGLSGLGGGAGAGTAQALQLGNEGSSVGEEALKGMGMMAAIPAGMGAMGTVPGAARGMWGAVPTSVKGFMAGTGAAGATMYGGGRAAIEGGKDLVNRTLDAGRQLSDRLPQDAGHFTRRSGEALLHSLVGVGQGLKDGSEYALSPETWRSAPAPNAAPWASQGSGTQLNQTAAAVNPRATASRNTSGS